MTAAGAVSSGESSRPSWVLLNMYARLGKILNETTAHCDGRNDVKIYASLVRERPPLPSSLFVHCSGATIGELPCVLSMVDNLILFHVYFGPPFGIPTPWTSDFFMYRADPKCPSLELLPRAEILISRDHPFGIFPRGEDHYTIASLIPLGSEHNLFSLRLYDSETKIWSWKKLYVESPQKDFPVDIPDNFYPLFSHHTSTVITLGETTGWVDLWRGILFCHMLSEKHTLSGIPLPLPLKCTEHDPDSRKTLGDARSQRGIAFTNGRLRLVEVGLKVVCDVPNAYDEETGLPCCRTENWTITTWTKKSMSNSYDDWHMDCTLQASEIFFGGHSEFGPPPIDLQNLFVSDPTIGITEYDSQVVYLTARAKFMHPKSWVLAIDTRDRKVQSLAVSPGPPPQEMRYINASYCSCSISK
ncbi:unnamed protein product [Alopecurus aequalis]